MDRYNIFRGMVINGYCVIRLFLYRRMPYYTGLGGKMLACGNPEKMG